MIIIIIALTALCDKEPPKILLSSSCVGHLLLVMGPSLKNGLCIQRDAIGENYFFPLIGNSLFFYRIYPYYGFLSP